MSKKEPQRKQYLTVFQDEFKDDLAFWTRQDRKVAEKIDRMIEAILLDPFRGIGKPKPLKHWGPGIWSRRITQEDRIVYLVDNDTINFLQCRLHY